MNGLISFKNFALDTSQSISRELLELNEISKEYGLVLSEEDAKELSDTRNKSLADNDRIEIGVGAVAEIIKRFSKSRYVDSENYTYVLNSITEIFYYIKTETNDKINDDELISELFKRFELNCRGSVDVLVGREAERIIRKIVSGENYERWFGGTDLSDDTSRESPVNVLRDEYSDYDEYSEIWDEDEYLRDDDYDEEDIDAELDSFDEYLDTMAEEGDDDPTDYYLDDKEEDYDDEEDDDTDEGGF